jgi:hypothetical protein
MAAARLSLTGHIGDWYSETRQAMDGRHEVRDVIHAGVWHT